VSTGLIVVGQIRPQTKFLALAIALLLGGAIGNVYDRISYGYVIDFIHVYYQTWHFPMCLMLPIVPLRLVQLC
jgi:signal peptidase II